ncbi:hypothetical protein, partial [Novosphingobium sp. MBES04]|uniref:hypothetical protein n=1 Tax=Novosphingobium sp. MBES04 TaxID=1206458 RepID=UPI001A7F09CE
DGGRLFQVAEYAGYIEPRHLHRTARRKCADRTPLYHTKSGAPGSLKRRGVNGGAKVGHWAA